MLLILSLLAVSVYKEPKDKCDQRGYHAPTELDSKVEDEDGETCRDRMCLLMTSLCVIRF